MSRLLVACLAVGILLTALATSVLYTENQKKQLPILEGIGGNFTLPGTTGHSVKLSDFRDKVVILNFGFTSCPDVCPTVLARMRSVLQIMAKDSDLIQPLFVTIDPERDKLDTLKSYLDFFDSSFIGLRGDPQQLKDVAALYKVLYQKETLDSALDYGFLHNDHIYLIDQQGRTRAMFSSSVKPAAIANQINTLL